MIPPPISYSDISVTILDKDSRKLFLALSDFDGKISPNSTTIWNHPLARIDKRPLSIDVNTSINYETHRTEVGQNNYLNNTINLFYFNGETLDTTYICSSVRTSGTWINWMYYYLNLNDAKTSNTNSGNLSVYNAGLMCYRPSFNFKESS